jgi:NADPH:quinone reductase-like Zn-dependent oxidoreductase
MPTIRKAIITESGDESKVTVIEGEISTPSAKEVQVRVEFSGFSGADINMRRGISILVRQEDIFLLHHARLKNIRGRPEHAF